MKRKRIRPQVKYRNGYYWRVWKGREWQRALIDRGVRQLSAEIDRRAYIDCFFTSEDLRL